jgi:hypothetical protein
MLAVSGRLDPTAGGPGIADAKVLAGVGTDMPTEYGYAFTDTRRSVYTPAFRNRRPELFDAFDAADPNAVTGSRPTSTVAPQALFMLNSPFVMEQAQAAAARLLAEEAVASDAARIERAFLRVLARPPTPAEGAAVGRTLARTPGEPAAAWASVFQALFGCIDFRTLE